MKIGTYLHIFLLKGVSTDFGVKRWWILGMVRSFGGEYVFEVEDCVGGGFIKEKMRQQ